MKVKNDFIVKRTKRRSGLKLDKVVFITAHDTGNPNSTAQQNVNYYKRTANEQSASAHVFVDDIEIIKCIPLDEKAWHVRYDVKTDNAMFGDDANDISIGVELCYSSRGGKIDNLKAYENYVWYIATLCEAYDLTPKEHIVAHSTLDPARKTDPDKNSFKLINKTWNGFIKDVEAQLKKLK